jgi:hypothetical protein
MLNKKTVLFEPMDAFNLPVDQYPRRLGTAMVQAHL